MKRLRKPGIAGQFTFARGRWARICGGCVDWLRPRNSWSATDAMLQAERRIAEART